MDKTCTRTTFGAALVAGVLAFASIANAQPSNVPPIMQATTWATVETSGHQTWDGTWTFLDQSHTVMSGSWVNRTTHARVYAKHMRVRQAGMQIIIERPELGNYVGTLEHGGHTLAGTMSWVKGHFTARP
jgi:Spy/CpxP family protein refolding chaperone